MENYDWRDLSENMTWYKNLFQLGSGHKWKKVDNSLVHLPKGHVCPIDHTALTVPQPKIQSENYDWRDLSENMTWYKSQFQLHRWHKWKIVDCSLVHLPEGHVCPISHTAQTVPQPMI